MITPRHHVLSRRAVLVGAGLAGPAAALTVPSAEAATGWRLMPEAVTFPAKGPAAHPCRPDFLGGAILVPGDPVPYHDLHGRRVVHITMLGNLLSSHTTSWLADHDRDHLRFCAQVLDGLAQRGQRRQGALFLSYEFDWQTAHGLMRNPWHSSFGQSKFPAVLHTMYQGTGERKWLLMRDQVLQAFRLPPIPSRPDLPWIAGVDANDCLWLDEYPAPGGQLSTVFNGHYYAMAELGMFASQANHAPTRELVRGAAATLDFYRNICRSPGRFSNYYANTDTKVSSYHYINMSCYLGLYNATGAVRIGHTVDQMLRDWPVTGGLAMMAGAHARLTGRPVQVMQGRGGGPGPVSAWTPGAAQVVAADNRIQWPGTPGIWIHMASGPRKGWYVRETPDVAWATGDRIDRADFTRPRTVTLPGKVALTGIRLDASGLPVTGVHRALPAATTAHSTARARIAGRHQLYLSDGPFAGTWLPESTTVAYR